MVSSWLHFLHGAQNWGAVPFPWSLIRMGPWYLPPKRNRESSRKEPISLKCPKYVGQAQAKEKCKHQKRDPTAHVVRTSTLKCSQGRGERKGYHAPGSKRAALQSIPHWFTAGLQSGDIHVLPMVKKPHTELNAAHKTQAASPAWGSGLTSLRG